jgi:hypothetical protein
MNFWRHVRLIFTRGILASFAVLMCAQQVLAIEEAEGPKVKSYALPYLLVGLMIIFGLSLALRPSLRQKEFRPPTE